MSIARATPLAFILLAACGGSAENNAAANNATVPTSVETIEDPDSMMGANNEEAASGNAAVPTDDWVGRWTGPEGLFLDIQPAPNGKPGHYAITNKDNLDRQADYQGVAEGATIRFVRDGKDIAIKPGKGADTGFKWLADKQDCLIVQPGVEGYCR